MAEELQFKCERYIKKPVSNAGAIVTQQIGLPLGVLRMERIIFWINRIEPLSNIDLQIFSDYFALTREFPIGTVRLFYDKNFLKKFDKELDKLTLKYKDKIIDKCFEIIDNLGDEKST
jgi:hypothetical protein